MEEQKEMPMNEAGKNPQGGAERDDGPASVVFKLNIHCDECATKIKKIARRVKGVEAVEVDTAGNKLTVIGKVDPAELQDKLEQKTKRKVELATENLLYEEMPMNEAGKNPQGGAEKDDGPASVVFKLRIHCDGCANKITKIACGFEGVEAVEVDTAGDKLTVIGKVDPAKLQDKLEQRTKRKVELAMENLLYEVFLSFRGGDTRSSFTSHLCAFLQNAGITVFKDDDALERGDDISRSLPRAIEQSQISVIVFSTNYGDSKWCLDELVKIMKCHRTRRQVVVPMFYDVDPSEVRHQTGEFGKAFQSLLNRNSVEEDESPNQVLSWKEALREAAGLAGFVVPNSRNESEAIKGIVDTVIRLLDKTDLFIADNPVGVESRVRDMIQLLEIQQSNDVLLLGVWGMGGVGKTTIAKAIYNQIGRKFEARSFLANIREVWEQIVGQLDLQKQLLFDIFKETTTKIQSIDLGKKLLKDRLSCKRVLLVLDDVTTLDQLNALCGSREWFCLGSRIIITSRDINIFRGSRVDQVYIMKAMDEIESLELFSWHAFKQASPKEDFAGISRNIVEYSGGLPLALEVLGSYLFGREVTEWKCVLEKIKRIPNDQVQKKLKISYDGLNDDTEKEIFLDIACFFIGMDRNDVTHILNGCELYAEIGISVLVERSLVTVDDRNMLGMHDLVRDMGREIIREKSPKEPEERSRLWFYKDVLGVLSEQTGTKAIEGLSLKLPRDGANRFSTEAFQQMKKLRLLQLAGVQLDGDFKYLSTNLRWLYWNGFPLTCIPANFYQGNLVSIELENSNVKLLWKVTQDMNVGGCGGCLLPGDSYPDWLTFNCESSSVCFEFPQVEGHISKAMMCIVYSSTPDNITSDGLKNMLVINHTKTTIQLYKREALTSFENEEWQRVVSNIEPGNKVEVIVVFGNGFIVKKTTVYLVYDDITSMCPPPRKVNTMGAPMKGKRFTVDTSTKRDPSYWERVIEFYASQHDSASTPTSSRHLAPLPPNKSAPTSARQSVPPPQSTSAVD